MEESGGDPVREIQDLLEEFEEEATRGRNTELGLGGIG